MNTMSYYCNDISIKLLFLKLLHSSISGIGSKLTLYNIVECM